MRKSIGNVFLVATTVVACIASQVDAKDYFLTIGGGYAPKGNQASMEANVLFFDQLLAERPADQYEHFIYFADGADARPDVQVSKHPGEPSIVRQLLADMFDWDIKGVTYRDHQVAAARGSNQPKDVRAGFDHIVDQLTVGDRFFVYVTAHGGSAKSKNDHDTKIYTWGKQTLRASEFALWLDRVPTDIPVYMVMAQCYCGGYAHTIFPEASQAAGLADGLRCGFFAQQHNLPAAGCRPDISNDREYSSYFWGAIAGRSRNGQAIESADRNGDGVVSFAEAHIYAVLEGETIDIPLRCTDALLRTYSKTKSDYVKAQEERRQQQVVPEESGGEVPPVEEIAAEQLAASDVDSEPAPAGSPPQDEKLSPACDLELDPELLLANDVSLAELVARADFVEAEIVRGITEQLQIDPQETRDSIRSRLGELQRLRRRSGRGGRSRAREAEQLEDELRDEILANWPELEKVDQYSEVESVGLDLASVETEITTWEAYERFEEQFQDRSQRKQASNDAELEQVKLKRLLQAIDSIVFANNLKLLANDDIVERYERMIEMEQGTL